MVRGIEVRERNSSAAVLRNSYLRRASVFLLTTALTVVLPVAGHGPAAAQAEQTRFFDIPSQDLSAALRQFARQSGLQLAYTTADISGLKSASTRGTLTPPQALARLLAGTGVSYRFTAPNVVALRRPGASDNAQANVPGGAVLDPISVEGQNETATGPVRGYTARLSATGTKTGTPLIETPQVINVVTGDQIKDQGAQNLAQALRYTAGVTGEVNGESAHYDELRIRGFLPIQYLDGMAVPLNQYFATPRIETYGLERVEVLKGPSSGLYGQNAPGGLVNMVSKRPTDQPLREVQLQTGSYDRVQGAFDFSGPVDAQKQFLYRLTGLVRDADTMVDFNKDERVYIAPAFTWRPNLDTTLTVLTHYGQDKGSTPQHYLPAQGTLLDNPNGRISRNRFAGEPDYDRFDRKQFALGYQFEHRFSEALKFRQNARYAGVDTYFQAHRVEGLQADLRNVNRSAFTQDVDARTFTIDNQAELAFATGALQHKVLLGLDYLRTSGNYAMNAVFPASSLDLYNPVYGAPVPGMVARIDRRDTLSQLGVYAQDQIKFNRWILTLVGRHDWATSAVDNHLAVTSTSADDKAFSGRAGLSYLFDNGLAPYISYATSFQPSVGADASGNPFRPSTGTQYEAGIKYQPPGSNILMTLAAFDLTRDNIVTTDPNFVSRQIGSARVRGIEAEVRGNVTPNVELIASYSNQQSEIIETANPLELGRPLPLTPRQQASAWGTYSFLDGSLNGLKVGAGARYVGANYSETETADPIRVPAATLFDALVQYDLSVLNPTLKGATLSVNATNLFDKYHVTYCYTTVYCSLGAGRVVLATLNYRW